MNWRKYVAPVQVESVRKELESALEGENRYGGDEAEIYAYCVQLRDPMAEAALRATGKVTGMLLKAQVDAQSRAALALSGICSEFQHKKKCRVRLEHGEDWLSPKSWLKAIGHRFGHRVHVRVTRR